MFKTSIVINIRWAQILNHIKEENVSSPAPEETKQVRRTVNRAVRNYAKERSVRWLPHLWSGHYAASTSYSSAPQKGLHTMSPACEHCLPASLIKTNTFLSTGDMFSCFFPPGAERCVCFESRCRQHESVSTCKPITRFRVSLLPDWLSTNQLPATAANYFTRSACAQVDS